MKKILIVEDNALNMELTTQLLEDDYTVLQATDGVQGVSAAERYLPDLILMDLSLPKLDGWQAIEQLRAKRETRSIPIIALSAHVGQADVARAVAAGCTAYVTKPIDEGKLLEEIASALRLVKHRP